MDSGVRYFPEKRSSSGKLKGVSEVISAVLLVMVTVVLVFFVNGTFMQIAQNAGTSTEKILENNNKLTQRIIIPTAYGCGQYICFEVKSLGTNSIKLPMDKAGYYINDVPKSILPWTDGNPGLNCADNPVLSSGQSCFGKIPVACSSGTHLKIVQEWGIEAFKIVSICK